MALREARQGMHRELASPRPSFSVLEMFLERTAQVAGKLGSLDFAGCKAIRCHLWQVAGKLRESGNQGSRPGCRKMALYRFIPLYLRKSGANALQRVAIGQSLSNGPKHSPGHHGQGTSLPFRLNAKNLGKRQQGRELPAFLLRLDAGTPTWAGRI